ELFAPIPDGIPYADWWLTLRAAQVSEIDYVREPLALYREHGANLTSGVSGAAGVREHRKEIDFQLWALRNVDLSALTPDEARLVWNGVEYHARALHAAAGSLFARLADVDDSDRERARQLDAAAAAAGSREAEVTLALQGLGWDPYDFELRMRVLADRN
ncbi:MAG TPA: hypothetical protein VME01_03210, partial [Solirubrobacteraceae bacterium]|nr:hypothetical protein [Solirubrobacteraceae bacterium]